MSQTIATLVAAGIGLLGLFLYGFLAFFFKRLVDQLDDMTTRVSDISDDVKELQLDKARREGREEVLRELSENKQ